MSLDSAQVAVRSGVATLVLAASTFVGIAQHESFVDKARIPVPGDKPTYGYGTTTGVKVGDRITPERAMHRLMTELDTVYAQGVRNCVKVPLHPWEFGAYVSLAYNVGVPTFCRKAKPDPITGKYEPNLIDLINAKRYAEAGERIEAFKYGPSPGKDKDGNKIKGPVLKGLVKRRAEERAICEGKRR